MRSKLMVFVVLCAALNALALFASEISMPSYIAILSGDQEVPSVDTKAAGHAEIELTADSTGLKYTIIQSGIDHPTAAHLHAGAPDTNGPVVAVLYTAPSAEPPKDKVLTKGVITAADLVGPFKGKTISDLLDAIETGNTYVNVHSKAHPDGEIRGRIREKTGK